MAPRSRPPGCRVGLSSLVSVFDKWTLFSHCPWGLHGLSRAACSWSQLPGREGVGGLSQVPAGASWALQSLGTLAWGYDRGVGRQVETESAIIPFH